MNELLLERIFEKVETIPPFPETAQRALEILREEEVNFKELERVVKSDPGIAANFLKLVNSPAFMLPQKVDSLLKAFMFLGVNQIKFIILASVAGVYFNRDLKGYGVSAQEIWLHSLTCGVLGELLGNLSRLSYEKIESLYIACLLHDLGKIVLDLYTNIEIEKFQEVIKKEPHWDFIQVEWLVLGVDHGLVGGYLFKKWGFPEEIFNAIRAHHDPDLMLQSKLSGLVALSNILANMIGFGGGIDAFYYKVPENLVDFLRLDLKDWTTLLKEAYIKVFHLHRSLL